MVERTKFAALMALRAPLAGLGLAFVVGCSSGDDPNPEPEDVNDTAEGDVSADPDVSAADARDDITQDVDPDIATDATDDLEQDISTDVELDTTPDDPVPEDTVPQDVASDADAADIPQDSSGDADSPDAEDVDAADGATDTIDEDIDAVEVDAEDTVALCEALEDAPLSLTLGTGVREWLPIEDGQEIIMAEGIQGGVHVWGSLAGTGFGGLGNSAEFEIIAADGERLGALFSSGRFECNSEAEALESTGLTVFINLDFDPMDLDGRAATIHTTLTTAAGETVSDERDVVLRCCDWLFGEP